MGRPRSQSWGATSAVDRTVIVIIVLIIIMLSLLLVRKRTVSSCNTTVTLVNGKAKYTEIII